MRDAKRTGHLLRAPDLRVCFVHDASLRLLDVCSWSLRLRPFPLETRQGTLREKSGQMRPAW